MIYILYKFWIIYPFFESRFKKYGKSKKFNIHSWLG